MSAADKDVAFLREAAEFFEHADSMGEDRAFWANVSNARRCREIADRLAHPPTDAGVSEALADAIVNFVADWAAEDDEDTMRRDLEQMFKRFAALSTAIPAGDGLPPFDMLAHLSRQRKWSETTFGPGPRTKGVIDHIRKELAEIEADPSDIAEWIDVTILALDGAWRAGHSPEQIVSALVAKQTKNEARDWPDWRTMSPDQAIEHVRSTASTAGKG